jgi:hypothetical protein
MLSASVVLSAAAGMVEAQTPGATIGSVRLTQAVTANGQPLAAGTYSVRLSDAAVTPVVGQSVEASHWVEFVQNGTVKGRELATVVPPADVKQIAKGTPPAAGSARVQMLKGADYLRVWLNRTGTQYLIHLSIAAK